MPRAMRPGNRNEEAEGARMENILKVIREAVSAWQTAGVQTIEWPPCYACSGRGAKGPEEPVCRLCKGSGRLFPGNRWRRRKGIKLFFTSSR